MHALTVLPAEFSELVTGSQAIVHGRVTDVRANVTADRRRIESLVTVSVGETLKGEPVPMVVFRVPGGQVGRYRRVMVGAPQFAEGDEVVVFLSGRPPAVPMPFGLSQGVYRVSREGGGRVVVTPPPVIAREPSSGRITRGDPARRPMPLADFGREVRAVAERAR